jgi:hypothetical protein
MRPPHSAFNKHSGRRSQHAIMHHAIVIERRIPDHVKMANARRAPEKDMIGRLPPAHTLVWNTSLSVRRVAFQRLALAMRFDGGRAQGVWPFALGASPGVLALGM